jgi:hypothetical protein
VHMISRQREPSHFAEEGNGGGRIALWSPTGWWCLAGTGRGENNSTFLRSPDRVILFFDLISITLKKKKNDDFDRRSQLCHRPFSSRGRATRRARARHRWSRKRSTLRASSAAWWGLQPRFSTVRKISPRPASWWMAASGPTI